MLVPARSAHKRQDRDTLASSVRDGERSAVSGTRRSCELQLHQRGQMRTGHRHVTRDEYGAGHRAHSEQPLAEFDETLRCAQGDSINVLHDKYVSF